MAEHASVVRAGVAAAPGAAARRRRRRRAARRERRRATRRATAAPVAAADDGVDDLFADLLLLGDGSGYGAPQRNGTLADAQAAWGRVLSDDDGDAAALPAAA